MQAVFAYLYALAQLVDGFIKAGSDLKNAALKSDIGFHNWCRVETCIHHVNCIGKKKPDGKLTVDLIPCMDIIPVTPSATQWGDIFGASSLFFNYRCSSFSNTDIKVLDQHCRH